jgi:hypothetical protein
VSFAFLWCRLGGPGVLADPGAFPIRNQTALPTVPFCAPLVRLANYILALPHEPGRVLPALAPCRPAHLDQADVAAVSQQIHLALFYDAQLDIKAMG